MIRHALETLDQGEPRLLAFGSGPGRPDDLVPVPMSCSSGGKVEVHVNPVLPAPVLIVAGSSPVALALVRLGGAMGYATVAEGAGDEALAEAADEVVDDLAETAARYAERPRGWKLYGVVATMGRRDERSLAELAAAAPDYLGVIASPTRMEEVRRVLAAHGVDSERDLRVAGPRRPRYGAEKPGGDRRQHPRRDRPTRGATEGVRGGRTRFTRGQTRGSRGDRGAGNRSCVRDDRLGIGLSLLVLRGGTRLLLLRGLSQPLRRHTRGLSPAPRSRSLVRPRRGRTFGLIRVPLRGTGRLPLTEAANMAMKNPPHPGRSIRENCLDPLGLNVTEAARVLGVARHTLSARPERPRGDFARWPSGWKKAGWSNAEFWLRRQSSYDLVQARKGEDRINVQRSQPQPTG